jgi:hypothetical protein
MRCKQGCKKRKRKKKKEKKEKERRTFICVVPIGITKHRIMDKHIVVVSVTLEK